MPELPEVETTVRGLRKVLDGQRITRVEPRRADLRRAMPSDLGQRLTGARVTGLGRRAKYGLIDTDRGDTLIFHLGMSGHWRIDPVALGPHDHLLIDTEAHRLSLNDPRRFGSIDLIPTAALDQWPAFRALGPEPLGDGLSGQGLRAAFAGRTAAVKLLLLDQRIIAGVGNIYACEALFRAGIHPARKAGAIAAARLDRLAGAVREVLTDAIAAGGSSLRDFVHPDGELGDFAIHYAVYGREGLACPGGCGGTVRRIVQGGRSTFYCPACQR
jgi:formamidopyrimidine-DNA glycosylase